MINYFVGLMLAPNANSESGIAIIDENNEIIFVDKLFSMDDIKHFFDNFPSIKNSKICVSLPWDNSMLNGKWRVLSKSYQLVASNKNFCNINNWTQRYSIRGSEYFKILNEKYENINRFELYLTRQALNLSFGFKERTHADCKALQNAIRLEHGYKIISSNMMPMSQLEAIVGAMLAKKIYENPKEKPIFEFSDIPVIRG